MSGRRITEGGRDLRRYLTEFGLSVPDFCQKHGLDRIRVQRVLNGERYKRISVEFAHSIERATDGRIPYTRFLPSTAVPAAEWASTLESTGTHDT
jgi:hypothetical protein